MSFPVEMFLLILVKGPDFFFLKNCFLPPKLTGTKDLKATVP